MSQLKINFGKRLQALRLDAEMTQEELADEIGVTVESISNIERGIFGPKFDNLEKIADVLSIPVKELFDFDAEWKAPDLQRNVICNFSFG